MEDGGGLDHSDAASLNGIKPKEKQKQDFLP